MSKNCIAIEYNSEECRIIQARNLKDSIVIEKAITVDSSDYTNLGKTLSAEGFNLSLPAIITADPQKCHFSNVDSSVDTVMPEDETDSLAPPVALDEAIRIHLQSEHKLAGHNPSSIVITTHKSAIDTVKQLADDNRIKCKNIELAVFALIAAANSRLTKVNATRLLVYIGKTRSIIIAFRGEEILLVRNIIISEADSSNSSIILKEIQLTWRAAFGEQITNDVDITVMNGRNKSSEIVNDLKANLACEISAIDINDIAGFSTDVNDAENYIPAAGAALLMFNSGSNLDINLLKSLEQAQPQQASNTQIWTAVALSVLLMLTLVSASLVKNISLNNQHKQIEARINEIFTRSLPEITNPQQHVPKKKLAIMEELLTGSQIVYQLYDKYILADKSATDIIQDIAAVLPTGSTVIDLNINGGSAAITIQAQNINTDELVSRINETTKFKVSNTKKSKDLLTIELTIAD